MQFDKMLTDRVSKDGFLDFVAATGGITLTAAEMPKYAEKTDAAGGPAVEKNSTECLGVDVPLPPTEKE